MTLVIVLFALALHRYVGVTSMMRHFNWFTPYLNFTSKFFTKYGESNPLVGVVVMVLPIFIIVALISGILSLFMGGILGVLFCFFVLLYCLDAGNWEEELQEYLQGATENPLPEKSRAAAASFIGADLPESEDKISRAVTLAIFSRAFENIFALVFWYALLGATGAITYFTINRFYRLTKEDETYSIYQSAANTVLGVLDWVPVRLTGLAYSLVGSFGSGFSLLLHKMVTGLSAAHQLACDFGIAGLGLKQGDSTDKGVSEARMALSLLDHSIIVWLVVIGLITIGGWVS